MCRRNLNNTNLPPEGNGIDMKSFESSLLEGADRPIKQKKAAYK